MLYIFIQKECHFLGGRESDSFQNAKVVTLFHPAKFSILKKYKRACERLIYLVFVDICGVCRSAFLLTGALPVCSPSLMSFQ